MSTRTTVIVFVVLFALGVLLIVVLPFFYFSDSGSGGAGTPPSAPSGTPPPTPSDENASPTDRGLFRSDDGGKTWQQKTWVEGGNESIASFRVNRLAVHPTRPETLFLATNGNGLWMNDSRGDLWAPVRDQAGVLQDHADVEGIAVNPSDPDEWYVAVYQNRRGRLLRSTDGGGSFAEVYATPVERFGVFDVFYDRGRGSITIATGQGGLFESTDQGGTWRTVRWFADGLTAFFVNPLRLDTRFAVSSKGSLFRTMDRGETWVDVTPSFKKFRGALENQHWVMDRAGGLYLGSAYGLLRSRDNAGTFASPPLIIPGGDAVSVIAVAIDPRNRRDIVVSTASQMYRSFDDGETWSILPPPSSLRVTHIAFDPSAANTLYAVVAP
ncbi:MAG: hypothetical protein A3B37_03725 [Candidatus Sungbacteria bacterium RIFCSPLOWO2_01_FULL_59_16]|uniref:Photosynthesis system II assembly factor Ycf48/Hcf136-like domain-containing protein n=1 Tax=Candidatus Sungbacteria bacterium RIFCSPLOWO2_01_FULL_59_16 TaxID=1802280 RepID=A0A1G2L9V0_9BACT|nr:MAG: hypothetical protein A3B37_03725 [Candidatus Sungbacteria bacterium RIFCSPLOWO2_01_FULL_59_16]